MITGYENITLNEIERKAYAEENLLALEVIARLVDAIDEAAEEKEACDDTISDLNTIIDEYEGRYGPL